MLDICKEYFDKLKITVSTNIDLKKSKTKCMAFGIKSELAPITLNGTNLPWWEESWPHLGHMFNMDQSPHHDLLKKRAAFIGKIHSFRQEFGNIDPIVYTKLVSIYLSSFYGSNLWDLYDNVTNKLFKTWNIMIRMTFDIPRNSHKYLIEPISQNSHLKVKLIKRFINFAKALSKCDKPHIKYLHDIQQFDYRSVYGRNCKNITAESGVDSILEASHLDIAYESVPPEEKYRISLIQELLDMRSGKLYSELTKKEICSMLETLCTD